MEMKPVFLNIRTEKASILLIVVLIFLLTACSRTTDIEPTMQARAEASPTLLPTPTQNIPATVEASIAATVISITSPTPDIEATVEARVAEAFIDATVEAQVTATAISALTPTPDVEATVEARVADAFIQATVEAQVTATAASISATTTAEARPLVTSLPLPGVPFPGEWMGGEEIAATSSTASMWAVGANGLNGRLHLIQIGRITKVTINLDYAGPGPYAAVIRRGGCPAEGEDPRGQFDYLLFDVVNGESISLVNTPAQFFQFSLAYVAVVTGLDLENAPLIACGNIPSPLR